MESYDYIIVGAGSAGCVLADRLTRSGRDSVLLIEAGPEDRDPLIHMPRGIGKLLMDERQVWHYPVSPEANAGTAATWHRGKVLGGSSSVNGMVYVRGDPSDYDAWEAQGLTGWNWQSIAAAFGAIEDHQLGAGRWRGAGGPLHVSLAARRHPVCDAFLTAGAAMGIAVKTDLNDGEAQEALGYYPLTIKAGRRWSAADAFLVPARKRPNLTVVTGTLVDRILFDGRRAVGVACHRNGQAMQYRAGREVILSAGALASPKLLMLSGVGAAGALGAAGIEPLIDSPAVGQYLREHPVLFMQYRLKSPLLSYNREFRGLRLARHVMQYGLTRNGLMALGAFEAGGFVKTNPDLALPDAQFLMSPFSLALGEAQANSVNLEDRPGVQCTALPLRPTSEGYLGLTGPDPDAQLTIRPNFLTTEEDRRSAVGAVRFVRRLFAEPALAVLVAGESAPGPDFTDDEQIIAAFRQYGGSGYHAVGTCRMGADEDTVTDPRLKVRGVSGLRVVDCSVMPTIPSGNTNGPVMALAWRAAGLILEDGAT